MADSSESIGRGSKRSFLGKKRAGSVASSKRSQPRPATSEKTEQAPPLPTPAQTQVPSSRSKPKKSGGLLSCLPCFGSREDAHAIDEEPSENVKQADKVRPGRTTQSTPLKKQDAAESSTADSKEPMDEKAGETYGRENEKAMQGDAAMDKPSEGPKLVTRSSSKKQHDQPLPPVPNPPGQLEIPGGGPEINVQQPTPVGEEGEQLIHDRTAEQEQRDTDIEMTDTQPSLPITANETHQEGEDTSAHTAQRENAPTKIELPPPPPLEERSRQVQQHTQGVAPPNQETPSITTPEQTQKALLPEIRPEFKGKKCLVLDLDETLVHSSFKVL